MLDGFFNFFMYLVFALAPVFCWLVFYFKKDEHPEPQKMILKVFILGIFSGCFAAAVELAVLQFYSFNSFWEIVLKSFLLIALVEELAKYLAVRFYALKSPELDEPVDVMIYMIISALGFAALENIIIFFSADYGYFIEEVFYLALLRFIGAVFLHTLTSGVLGFFIAMSFCSARNKKTIFVAGFLIAVFLHGLYNLAIIELAGFWQFAIPAAIIIFLSALSAFGFVKLKKIKSICKL